MGTFTLLTIIAIISQAAALVTSPPRIVKQPTTEEQLFQVAKPSEVDKPFIIECEAEGEPAPVYQWIKNGKLFDYTSYDNRITQQPGRGTLVVTQPRDEDLGQYQCFATNEWGTATSNSVFVRKTELNNFKEADDPQITVIADEGKPFKLSCQPPDGWPKPTVYWMLQGDQGQLRTINNSRMTLDPEGNLWFSNVTREDASVNFAYICAANSLFRNEYKFGNKVFLDVKHTGISPGQNRHPPVLQYASRRKEVGLRGKKIELYCIYGGTPLPQVVWKKNGLSILSSQRVTQDNYGKTLVLKRAQYEDEGSYTCEVSNGVGTAQSYSISLSIQSAPFFTEEPQLLNLAEGETAVFRCNAEGTPTPQIEWIHDGLPISDAPPNPRRQVTANQIIITDLVKKDTGNYGCNATNTHGYVYKDVYVNVQSIPPEIKEGPENITKVEKSEAIMRCRVFGAPRPIVQWFRGDVKLTGGRYNVTPEGDLVIRNVIFDDVGQYQCYAKNKLGEKSAFGWLTIKEKTQILVAPESYEVAAGNLATFRCNAKADSTLDMEISWLKDGQLLDLESQPRFHMTNDHSLVISDTTELDSGEYTCIAKTPIDHDQAQATLIVQDKPNAPMLDGIECHEREATLHWHPMGDNRAPILRFIIQYNTSFTPDSWDTANEDVSPTSPSLSIKLTPWANYTFRVIAENKIGYSAPSGHSDVCTTQPDVPYKNPDHVEGKGTDPTNMVISWSPMPQIEHNGPGFYYEVSWKENVTGQQYAHEKVWDWTKTQFIVQNTPTFIPYKIKVIAGNNKGTSNVAAVEYIGWSGEDVPTMAPTNFTLVQVTTATTALVSWTPVSPESVRGHFKGYKIQIWTDEDGEDNLRETLVQANANSTLVDSFVAYTKNYARIMVYNGRYNGPSSEILSFRTPEGKPGTVRSFEVYPIGSSAMLLKWEKPEKPNGVIDGYKIYYQKVTGTNVGPLQERSEINPKYGKAKLAGLEPNTKYRIEIRAKTKAGEGDAMFVEQSTKPVKNAMPDIPDFEAEFLPMKQGQTAAHIFVRWLPTVDGHAGTDFIAWYRLKGQTEWQHTKKITDEDYTVLTGLEPGQVYEVKITAHDGSYFRESEIKEVETIVDGPTIRPDEKMATAGWFIGVMLALAFLLLVLVLVCVVRRNRGGKYDVHDRELAHGRRDYAEGGFHEYTHPLDNKSRHSMSSGTKPGPESDTDSMAEYGEGETGRFTEDGSFIGQYVPGARVLPPVPAPVEPAARPITAAAALPATNAINQQPPTMRLASVPVVLMLLAASAGAGAGAGPGGRRSRHPKSAESRTPDISLWIDERQVRMFSGISMQVYAIVHGNVSPYILDPNFSHKLPIIPSEVGYVNFTWKAGSKFYYHFDTLTSSDPKILKPPVLSIKTKGRVPKRAKEFSIFLPCIGNNSGVVTFEIGLKIANGKGEPLKGTPLRLNLKKECAQRGPDPECDKKCANQGWCNEEKICQCPEGYMGQYCRTALCYPQCMNGGNCTAPGQCSCPPGYQGRHCEGGMCSQKCLNGGKCIQKDTCECPKGYYGLRCEFSKCVIPCLNGGKCKGVNKCRCPAGLAGDHCEVGRRLVAGDCSRGCRHGKCVNGACVCEPGWRGRYCHRSYGSSEESGEFKRPR